MIAAEFGSMTSAHLANLIVHVGAGGIALGIGFYILAKTKGTPEHRRLGRLFAGFTLIVSLSAIVGTLFFRFVPIFAVLSLLVPYQLVSGWRSIYTRSAGPQWVDGALTMLALAIAAWLVPIVLAHPSQSPIVERGSLGALGALLAYDGARWLFPRHWHRSLWRYEHSYKLVASIFAMLSALVGNVIRAGQPWSQVAPSALGMLVIVYFFARIHRDSRSTRVAAA
jgi:uncharacterized membrane protein